ncbi:MAG TPA: hypothetical protein VHM89_08955 [Acidimicrobiales bacterium]|nr:hypothetical protein [Acidimicrobiales bacterium]
MRHAEPVGGGGEGGQHAGVLVHAHEEGGGRDERQAPCAAAHPDVEHRPTLGHRLVRPAL